ncbi:unnamed protein product [Urochloa humidicola]
MGWAARFLTVVSFLATGIIFAPNALRISGSGDGAAAAVAAARLLHLLAFATPWGARYLPRHQFGSLQGKMFPAFLGVSISVSSAISVAAVGQSLTCTPGRKHQPSTSLGSFFQPLA